MNVPGVTAEFVQIGDVRMAEGVRLRRHRRSHLARHPVLSRLAEERGALRRQGHQQPVLVERRRQVLQLRAGDQARRRDSADGAAAAQGTSDRHDRAVDAQPALPARLGGDLRVRRLPRVPEAVRRRRLARRLQDQQPRGILQRLRSDAHALHDAAARGELQGILPLLRRRAGAGAHHALRSARAVPRALRAEPAGVSEGAARARRSATRRRCAARSATTSTPSSSPCEDGIPVRDRLHEPRAGRRSALGRPGELRLDRQRGRRPRGEEGDRAAARRRPIAGTRS